MPREDELGGRRTPTQETTPILVTLGLDRTPYIPPSHRRLDSIARLITGDHKCAAICFDEDRRGFLVSDNVGKDNRLLRPYCDFFRDVVKNYSIDHINRNWSNIKDRMEDLVQQSLREKYEPRRLMDLKWVFNSRDFVGDEGERRKQILDEEINKVKRRMDLICTEADAQESVVERNRQELEALNIKIGQLQCRTMELERTEINVERPLRGVLRHQKYDDIDRELIIGDGEPEGVKVRIGAEITRLEGESNQTSAARKISLLNQVLRTIGGVVRTEEHKREGQELKLEEIRKKIDSIAAKQTSLREAIRNAIIRESLEEECSILEQAKTEHVNELRGYIHDIELRIDQTNRAEDERRLRVDIEKVARSLARDSIEDAKFSDEMRDAFDRGIEGRGVVFLSGGYGLHAEMRILDAMVEQQRGKLKLRKPLYIGVTKLCCLDCESVMSILRDKPIARILDIEEGIETRGAHLSSYQWEGPGFLRSSSELMNAYLAKREELSKVLGEQRAQEAPIDSISPPDRNVGRRMSREVEPIPFALTTSPTRHVPSTPSTPPTRRTPSRYRSSSLPSRPSPPSVSPGY